MRERARAATQPALPSAKVAWLSSAGPRWSAIDGRPPRASTCVPVRGRLWKLDYVRGTGVARLGGARAVVGRYGGGVCGVCGASADARCEATLRALSVLSACLYASVRAPHSLSARLS